MKHLISKEEVKEKINNAETVLNRCFDMLLDLKYGRDNIGDVLVQFQPTLAKCLQELMMFYQQLKREQRELVDDKSAYETETFGKIMNQNKLYQDVVREVIEIGKSLGDAYAWFFYRDNRDELEKHFHHESTGLFVSGIGGYGEVEFITSVSQIDGLYVLYHSITDMLRIADFSLYNLNLGIVGTGELKTKKVDNTLSVTANIISKVNIRIQDTENSEHILHTEEKETINREFPKLEKQLKIQSKLMKLKPCDQSSNQFASYEYDLINQLSKDMPMAINEDNSLMLYAAWSEKDNLFDILFEKESMQGMDEGFEENVEKLMSPPSPYNEVIVGEIDTKMNHLRIPVLWWKIEDSVCREIYFKKIGIASIFNPAKILQCFANEGFEIRNIGKLEEIIIEKRQGDKHWEFDHLESLCDLVCHSLMRTEDVFAFYQEVLNSFEEGKIPVNTKVEMHIRLQNFGKKR